MKIVSLQAENVKRISAVEIRPDPDGNLVEITGENGAGKTSILDSIYWALAGRGVVQSMPIRRGEEEARITLDLGEFIVRRTFKRRDDGEVTTSIKVEGADGARQASPQKILDSLMGELSFDPLAFTRMKPREQFEALRRFVPDVDFDTIARAEKEDFDARTDVARRAKQAKARADGITVRDDTPEEPIDESALVAELEEAGRHNTSIEKRLALRQRAEDDVRKALDSAKHLRDKAADLRAQAERYDTEAAEHEKAAGELKANLAAIQPLPEPRDTTEIRERIATARTINQAVEARARKNEYEQEAASLEAQSETLTEQIKERQAEKQAKIAAARLPIKGLSFGDGHVTLDGVPFDQGSDAEQLRASIAIAMAMNPTLRVIRVRDGSLLSDASMRLLAQGAERDDYQIWLETVTSSRPTAIVIEDGRVRSGPGAEAAA